MVRETYTVLEHRLDDAGRCRSCGAGVAGIFDGTVGGWGTRRRPVVLGPGPAN